MKNPSDPGEQVWTISRLIQWTSGYFHENDIDNPRMTAELLLAYSLGIKRLDLYLQYDKPLTVEELGQFKSLIKRRILREPVAYITGKKGFWSLELGVSKNVLIPRPDTECIVEAALEVVPLKKDDSFNILDLGTGSGAIVLSLASERPDNRYYAVDISIDALKAARSNSLENVPDCCVEFVSGSWFGPISEKMVFDVIVSNPPYIPSGDIPGLQPEVAMYEPHLALDGGEDGLNCLRLIIRNAFNYLKPGGWLLLESGFDQKEMVAAIIHKTGSYDNVEFFTDLGGNDRVVRMQRIIE